MNSDIYTSARPSTSFSVWLQRAWPELSSVAVTFGSCLAGTVSSGLDQAALVWGHLALSCGIRLSWCAAELLHGAGHALVRALVDGDASALRLVNLLEHRSTAAMIERLLPLAPIGLADGAALPLPWLEVGSPARWRVRLKAAGGPLFNALAILVLMGPVSAGLPPLLLTSAIVVNGVMLLASGSDWRAMLSGRASRFYCGNFGFISGPAPSPRGELLPSCAIERLRTMGLQTEIRGAQAAGALVLVGDRHGDPRFVGHKLVNAKRGQLTAALETSFGRRRRAAARAGHRPLSSGLLSACHYRFGTSGPPAVIETHWHGWCPAQRRHLWSRHEGRWTRAWRTVEHRITHNGDFERFQLAEAELEFADVGRWLERVLHQGHAAVGDSPKIAGLMDLLITQGDWYAAVRLAAQQVFPQGAAAPASVELENWTAAFEGSFAAVVAEQPGAVFDPGDPAFQRLVDLILPRLAEDVRMRRSDHGLQRRWIDATIEAFLRNDPYRAVSQFMELARGSFGLVVVSSIWPERLVLASLGQPITLGFDPAAALAVYASEPAAVDAVLAGVRGAYRIDLDQNAGEVAVLGCADLTLHSLSLGREVSEAERLERRHFYGQDPSSAPSIDHRCSGLRAAGRRPDPVGDDLRSIPGLLAAIRNDWIDPGSANRQSADHLAQFLIAKAAHLAKKQALLTGMGLDPTLAKSRHVDLLITGVENSLWLGEQFARDLQNLMPLLSVRALSANAVLHHLQHDIETLGFARQSIVLVLSHSGQTFASRQVAETGDLLVRQEVIRELFVLTGEPTSFLGSPLLEALAPGEPFCRRLFTTGAGRRIAEPATASVAAMHQTLTELLFCLCRQVRQAFPDQRPLGLRLPPEELLALENMEGHLFLEDVATIIGADSGGQRRPTGVSRQLRRTGRRWALHVVETPCAWLIQSLYILVSVMFSMPLFRTLISVALPLVGVGEGELLMDLLLAVSVPADVALYVFGPWCWTVALRLAQGRPLLARTGRRTVVIGEAEGVHQLLVNYVSKQFALSFGITAIDVQGADPRDHLLHTQAHRVVRGTLLFLGVPDGRCSEGQRSQAQAAILTGRQADGIRHLGVGPEIVAVSSDPRVRQEAFSEKLLLPSQVHAGCEDNANPHVGDGIEALRESRFGSFRRLLAAYLLFWAMARRVSSLPLIGFDCWKTQSRSKVMTTAAPVSAARLDRTELEEIRELALAALSNREQS
ncbi:MAG: hypothetical protein NTW83_15455 [Cyanobacteria bacterium]|nr:hypothetical protein [Cyanobacteriota bacterium]